MDDMACNDKGLVRRPGSGSSLCAQYDILETCLLYRMYTGTYKAPKLDAMAIIVTMSAYSHAQRRGVGDEVETRHAVGSLDLNICTRDLNTVRDGVCAEVLAASSLVVDEQEHVKRVALDVSVH